MRVQFLHRHVQDTVVMLEEGNPPTHGTPDVTCRFPGRRSMGATWGPRSAKKGQRGRDGDWLRWKQGRTRSGSSEHMGNQWRR